MILAILLSLIANADSYTTLTSGTSYSERAIPQEATKVQIAFAVTANQPENIYVLVPVAFQVCDIHGNWGPSHNILVGKSDQVEILAISKPRKIRILPTPGHTIEITVIYGYD